MHRTDACPLTRPAQYHGPVSWPSIMSRIMTRIRSRAAICDGQFAVSPRGLLQGLRH